MVAKIESGKSIRGILHYNENKVETDQATLILASGFAGEIEKMNLSQKLQRFQHLTVLNAAVKTNALHISLNFDASDKINIQKLQQIAAEYMERIGFGDQPFLVYRHHDASHPHLHIATTNIQKDGNRIDIHGIGYKLSEPARKEMEIKYGLIKAEGRETKQGQKIRPAIYGERPTKQTISNIVSAVMRNYRYASLAEFNAVLQQFNIKAERGAEDTQMYQKRGLLYTILDHNSHQTGIPIKASRIYSKPTLDNLEKRFERNKTKRQPLKDDLKNELDNLFFKYRNMNREMFQKELLKQGIATVFRTSDQGQLYGITYIDHNNKTVFNGSELGKAYSAKALTERFEKAEQTLSDHIILRLAENKPSQQTHPYLQTPERTNFLETLLAQTQQESGIKLPKRKKKRRKGKFTGQDQQLTL